MGSYKALKDRPKASQRLNLKILISQWLLTEKVVLANLFRLLKIYRSFRKLLANFDEKMSGYRRLLNSIKNGKLVKLRCM